MQQKPSIGRIVHYHHVIASNMPPKVLAAVITDISDEAKGEVFLLPLHHEGAIFVAQPVKFGEHGEPQTWGWPPRV